MIWLSSSKCQWQPSRLCWELLQRQVDNSPIPRLWRRPTHSCSFRSYFQRSQEALPKAARYSLLQGKVTAHLVADGHSSGVPHDVNMSICSAPHSTGGKNHSTKKAERCSSFAEHKPQYLGIRDHRLSSEPPWCQPATPPAAMPGSSWRAVNRLPYLSPLQ